MSRTVYHAAPDRGQPSDNALQPTLPPPIDGSHGRRDGLPPMRAVHLSQGQLCLRSDLPQPTPAPGEALVRIQLAGICSTDLELVRGYYPFDGILGHEFVGVVEACEDAPEWIGRRVVATINFSPDCDGTCGAERCPEHCPDRTVLGIAQRDGIFSEYATIPVANLLEVPESLPNEVAVFAEPLAAAARIPEQVDVRNQDAVVIGPGRLGLLCAQVLRHEGAKVTVIGRSERSLELPRELGFPTLSAETPPEGGFPKAPLIIESTANATGLRFAVDLCSPGGTIVLKSTYADDPEANPFAGFASSLAQIVVNEIRVVGSRCGPFDRALELLSSGVVQTAPLLEKTYPLDEAMVAFDYAARPGVRKVLLDCESDAIFERTNSL